MNPVWNLVLDIWYVFREASLYVLFGFLVAAMIQASVAAGRVSAVLGQGRWRSILLASLIGIPLPLCSCSVLPTALALRQKGARRGATMAFLISTPETGVDSIVLTYGLMDPLMTIFRPLSAMFTATVAGLFVDRFGGPEERPAPQGPVGVPLPLQNELPWRTRFSRSFHMLFGDLSHWIFVGLVLSGVIGWLVPPNALAGIFGTGLTPMLVMLVLGLPLYICAAGSTPLAAALIYKGLSPGAALVFLLVGPATNIGTMGVVAQNFGKRVLAIYLGTLVALSLLLGSALNWVYDALALDPVTTMGAAGDIVPLWLRTFGTVILVALFLRTLFRVRPPRELSSLGEFARRMTGLRLTARRVYGIFLAVVLAGYLSTGILVVRPGEVGMIRRFGALVRTDLSPGIYFDLPVPFTEMTRSPVEQVQALTIGFEPTSETDDLGYHRFARLTRQEVADREFFCGDWNLLDVNCSLLYRIRDPRRFHFEADDPPRIVEQAARASLVNVFSGRDVDGVLTFERKEIEAAVLRRLADRLERYGVGVEVLDFSLLDVHAPAEVHPVFRAVAGAAEEKLATILSASAEAVVTLSEADIDQVRAVNGAAGTAEGRIRDASGFSAAFAMRAGAYEENPVGLRRHLALEAAAEVLPRLEKRMVPVPAESVRAGVWFFPGPGSGTPAPVRPQRGAEKEFPFWDMGGNR